MIIDGKALAQKIREKLKARAESFEKKRGRKIGLAVILCGGDAASLIYVKNKIKACEETGIKSFSYYLPESVAERELTELIAALNADGNADGILVQLPLPRGLDERKILSRIEPSKDADGFTAVSAGNLFLGGDGLAACTPAGCIELIKSTGVNIEGKFAVVVGRSNIVGKPAAMLLLKENATVAVCHSKTAGLAEITRRADILIAAVGRPEFIKADMVKRGAVVIDVGINRTDGGLKGDVDFNAVKDVAGFITPVPGGVGPMTVAMLLSNTVKAAEDRAGISG